MWWGVGMVVGAGDKGSHIGFLFHYESIPSRMAMRQCHFFESWLFFHDPAHFGEEYGNFESDSSCCLEREVTD